MLKTRLLASVCVLGLLAAPAMAQGAAGQGGASNTGDAQSTTPPGGMPGNNGSTSTPGMGGPTAGSTAQSGTPSGGSSSGSGSKTHMAATKGDSSNLHAMHMSGHAHHGSQSTGSSGSPSSSDSMADQLNGQSLQAAEQGRSFDAGSAGAPRGNSSTQ